MQPELDPPPPPARFFRRRCMRPPGRRPAPWIRQFRIPGSAFCQLDRCSSTFREPRLGPTLANAGLGVARPLFGLRASLCVRSSAGRWAVGAEGGGRNRSQTKRPARPASSNTLADSAHALVSSLPQLCKMLSNLARCLPNLANICELAPELGFRSDSWNTDLGSCRARHRCGRATSRQLFSLSAIIGVSRPPTPQLMNVPGATIGVSRHRRCASSRRI